jgi:hypothetical protein
MVWKNYIVRQFGRINHSTTNKNEFYAAYSTLLLDLFPPEEYYDVAPQFRRNTWTKDCTISFVVLKGRTPIFFVEIKTFVALELDSARDAADNQMRTIFLDFSSYHLPQPKLIGISAMGTHFAVYEYTPNDHRINPSITADTAPKERWSDDIMEDSGEAKLKALVNEVKEMASAVDKL